MERVDVAIIGSGFGGLGMAVELQKAGVGPFVILEREDRVGGTWRDNTYPGAACDVTSVLYSFSFHPYVWSRKFPTQPEILEYIEEVVDAYGLRPSIRFDAEVADVIYSERTGRWTVTLSDGRVFDARVVVSSVGQLNRPAMPQIEGVGSFDGPAFHSARWEHNVELAGKRVGIIGTGASVIQFGPKVAERADSTMIFQRSAPYILEKKDPANSPLKQRIYGLIKKAQLPARAKTFLFGEFLGMGILGNKKIRKRLTDLCVTNMEEIISDPQLRAQCTPDYEVGCKRVLFAEDWYQTLLRDDVELVTQSIASITPNGVMTSDGVTHECDVLIYGTGFEATGFLQPMNVVGAQGKSLEERWEEGASAYRGVAVSGFPNFFILYGPNTNLGSNSIIYMLESQARYVASLLAKAQGAALGTLSVRPGSERSWQEMIDRFSGPTSWVSGCSSWYTTGGKNTNNWPRATWRYRQLMKDVDLLDYDVKPLQSFDKVSAS